MAQTPITNMMMATTTAIAEMTDPTMSEIINHQPIIKTEGQYP